MGPIRRPRTLRTLCVLTGALLLGPVLAACGSDEAAPSGTASPGGSPTGVTESPSPTVSPSSPTGATSTPSVAPSEQEAQGTSPILGNAWTTQTSDKDPRTTEEGLIFHQMRVGEHATFYRVVIEFSGSGQPGWIMSWAESPVEQARGLPLDVSGTSFLNLAITGTRMPGTDAEQGLYYSGPSNLTVGPLDVVEDGTFEDQTHIVIGMDDVRKFQVGTLTDPVRVVIDVKK